MNINKGYVVIEMDKEKLKDREITYQDEKIYSLEECIDLAGD